MLKFYKLFLKPCFATMIAATSQYAVAADAPLDPFMPITDNHGNAIVGGVVRITTPNDVGLEIRARDAAGNTRALTPEELTQILMSSVPVVIGAHGAPNPPGHGS